MTRDRVLYDKIDGESEFETCFPNKDKTFSKNLEKNDEFEGQEGNRTAMDRMERQTNL